MEKSNLKVLVSHYLVFNHFNYTAEFWHLFTSSMLGPVVYTSAFHARDQGSIPRLGKKFLFQISILSLLSRGPVFETQLSNLEIHFFGFEIRPKNLFSFY